MKTEDTKTEDSASALDRESEDLLTAAFGDDPPKPRPPGADKLTARDREAIRDVGTDCGEEIADAFERRLIDGATVLTDTAVIVIRGEALPPWVPEAGLDEVTEAMAHSVGCVLAVQDGEFAFWQMGTSDECELAAWLVGIIEAKS